MCLPLDELVHTNQMKLWTIYHGKIFPLNELNMCVFFSLSFGVCLFFFVLIFFSLAFILLPSLVSERGWRYMCMRPHIFSHLYQTNFKLRPGATIIYSFKYEMRKSQCDLPTHNLNCIYWSMKMVISNKTCIASQHRTSARNCNIHSSEHEHGLMLNIDIHTFLHILFWCFTPFSHDLFFSSVFSFVCVCSLAEGKCLHQSVQWITTKCEKKPNQDKMLQTLSFNWIKVRIASLDDVNSIVRFICNWIDWMRKFAASSDFFFCFANEPLKSSFKLIQT